jgi:hypothetical protein
VKIVLDDDGDFYLIDYGSENGTFVNEVKANGSVRLKRNDVIRIGNTVLPWKGYFPERKIRTVTTNYGTTKPTNTGTVNVFAAICSFILIICFFLPWINVIFFQIPGYDIPLKMNTVLGFTNISGEENTKFAMITFASYSLYLIPLFAIINFVSYLGTFDSRCKYMEFVTAKLICIALVIFILVETKIPFEDLIQLLAPGFYITFGISVVGLIASGNKN